MRYLKTNTATIVTVGPFYDKTDGVTIENALTITAEKITFVVDANDGSAPTLVLDNVTGATSGTDNDLNYITNCDAGLMQIELSQANTNYLGRAFLTITDAANHVPVFHEFTILPAVVYDALIAGTDLIDVSMTQILGTAVSTPATAGVLDVNIKNIANAVVNIALAQLGVNVIQAAGTAWASGAITANSIATGAIDADSLAADAGTEIGTAVWATAARTLTAATNITSTGGTTVPQTGDSYARLGAPTGASVSADVAAVKAETAAILDDTDDIGIAGAGLTAVPWNVAWDAEVQSEATDALNAYDPPTKAELDSAAALLATAANLATLTGYVDTEVAAILAAVDSEVAAIKAKTDNLPAAPAATGDIPTATENADALLKRDMSAVTGEAARSPLNALRSLRNKVGIVTDTLTVYKEDDTTSAWTAAVTGTTGADPITAVDPA